MDPAQFHNATRVRQFIAETRKQFGHMLITEHYDESLIVMRRKLCWGNQRHLVSSVTYWSPWQQGLYVVF